jgi:hypothetical protein
VPSTPSDYREAAIEDMLGKPPGWLLHSGIGAIGIVVIVILFLASFIRYPDKLSAPFLLQTQTVPLALHLSTGDIIDTVFAKNGDQVALGDTLLILRSSGDWKSIRSIAERMQFLDQSLHIWDMEPDNRLKTLSQFITDEPNDAYPEDIQVALVELNIILTEYESYQLNNGVSAQVAAYQKEITEAERLSSSIQRQVSIQEEELAFEQQHNQRMNQLVLDQIVSPQEAEQAASRALSVQRQREALVSSDIQNQIQVQQLNQRILDRRLAHRENLAKFARLADAQLKKMHYALNAYRNRYIVVARETGVINWQPAVREQAAITTETLIGFILQDQDRQRIVARLQLPGEAQGKASIGDRVLLEFSGYPSREFGQVEGSLNYIDPIAFPDQNGGYLRQAEVALPDTIRTSYDKQLAFQFNLSGTAQIITADRTLLQRIMDRFTSLTKNT